MPKRGCGDNEDYLLGDEDQTMQIVHYPPMITRTSECKGCFSKEVCSLAALSLEDSASRKPPMGEFPAFLEMQKKITVETKEYFKKFIECINIEQSAEQDRQSSSY